MKKIPGFTSSTTYTALGTPGDQFYAIADNKKYKELWENKTMNQKFTRIIWRILKSLLGYILVVNKRALGVRKVKELGKYNSVHIVCPGPSAKSIESANINSDDAVIFVNFAVKLAPKISRGDLFFLTADMVRYKEVMESTVISENIKNSILLLATTFRCGSDSTWRTSGIIVIPHYRFKWPLGLSANIIDVKKLSEDALGCELVGFGSLNYALQVAARMSTQKIILHGCDFGPVKGKHYGVSGVPVRNNAPYDIIKNDFDKLVAHLEKEFNKKVEPYLLHGQISSEL